MSWVRKAIDAGIEKAKSIQEKIEQKRRADLEFLLTNYSDVFEQLDELIFNPLKAEGLKIRGRTAGDYLKDYRERLWGFYWVIESIREGGLDREPATMLVGLYPNINRDNIQILSTPEDAIRSIRNTFEHSSIDDLKSKVATWITDIARSGYIR